MTVHAPQPTQQPTTTSTATITVYTRTGCVQCKATFRDLDKQEIPYQTVWLDNDTELINYIKNELGHQQVPVVVTPDQHWSGYRPDLIKQLVQPQ